MKHPMLIVIVLVVVIGAGVILVQQGSDTSRSDGDAAPGEKTADAESAGPHAGRDANGNVVIEINARTREDMGIQVTNLPAVEMSPELKGYGRVLDPSPLAALVTELATARASYAATSNELARLKTMESQGNASARALQEAEAVALRDQLVIQSAGDRLALLLGKAMADQADLPAFVQSLTAQDAVLVRIDLPLGEILQSPPTAARIVALSGATSDAKFLGMAPTVDPQIQGRGFLFLIKPNDSGFAAGEAVTGYLKLPGAPITGVIIPSAAVVRTEGVGWVYVADKSGESYTRIEVALDQTTEAGWFVTRGVTANDAVVVSAAQQLLSAERKGQAAEE